MLSQAIPNLFARLSRFSEILRMALPAILALVLQVQFFGSAQPPAWPDEALFSNPAGELARGNGFKTMVLEGLVPGMEEATLWNSPLYMTLLSGVYRISGESLEAGRGLSLFLGILILIVFSGILHSLRVDRPLTFIAPLLLAMDPSFVRGSNVIRMDGLCLLFCMLALYFSYRAFQYKRDHYSFISGVFLGLGAMSHPAALYGVAFVLMFHVFRWRGIFFAVCGTLLALSPWLAYIAEHFDIFALQFIPQLMRKSGLLSLWGGPTGGIFVVFTSQYGGGATSMLMVGLLVAFASILLLFIWKERLDSSEGGLVWLFRNDSLFLLSLSWPLVMAFCLLSVEGWYAMHVFPYLLLSTAAFFSSPFRMEKLRRRAGWLFRVFGLMILFIGIVNAHRYMVRDSDEIVDRSLKEMTEATSECSSVFARMVPDPYFSILEARPETRYYEFVPAKLSFPAGVVDPVKKYRTIDCFLLEGSGLQDGEVDRYIQKHIEEFERIPLAFSQPANTGHLFKRKK